MKASKNCGSHLLNPMMQGLSTQALSNAPVSWKKEKEIDFESKLIKQLQLNIR